MEDEINRLIKKVFGSSFEVTKAVDFQDYLYVFSQDSNCNNPYNDERLQIIGGYGPLKINKKTFDYEITDLIDFYFEHGDNELFFPNEEEEIINFEKVKEDILMRKRINWDDFVEVFKNSNLDLNELDLHSIGSIDEVYIQVKTELAYNVLIDFLKELKAKYSIDTSEKYKLFINLNLLPTGSHSGSRL